MDCGKELAARFMGDAREDLAETTYVSAVGQSLARHVRRKAIRYQFHLVISPVPNAYALPGGQVYVTSAMFALLDSEAELAMILGREIAHVDLRHCIERYQYTLRFKRVGAGTVATVVDVLRMPFEMSYARYQELDADAEGLALAVRAGYDPQAAAGIMTSLAKLAHVRVAARPRTPAGELAQASAGALRVYFRSHPMWPERIAHLERALAADKQMAAGRSGYVGRQNLRLRIARTRREFPAGGN